jgi:hypothetical protein
MSRYIIGNIEENRKPADISLINPLEQGITG